jgi:hypothetical protein
MPDPIAEDVDSADENEDDDEDTENEACVVEASEKLASPILSAKSIKVPSPLAASGSPLTPPLPSPVEEAVIRCATRVHPAKALRVPM